MNRSLYGPVRNGQMATATGVNESPEYRAFFAKLVMDSFNHRITYEYLDSRLEYYDRLGEAIGVKENLFLRGTHFFKHRADYMISQMAKFPFFGVSENYECHLSGPGEAEYVIDGYSEPAGYKGRYFEGMLVEIKVEILPCFLQF